MKIRNGFVSNSSSSSFILKIPFYPECVDDVKRMLLGDEDPLVLTWYDDDGFPTQQVMEIIYNDIVNAIGKEKKRPMDSISKDDLEISEYNINNFDKKISPRFRTEYNRLKKEFMVAHEIWDKSYMDRELEKLPPAEKWKICDGYLDNMNHIGDKMKDIIYDSFRENSLDTDIHITVVINLRPVLPRRRS